MWSSGFQRGDPRSLHGMPGVSGGDHQWHRGEWRFPKSSIEAVGKLCAYAFDKTITRSGADTVPGTGTGEAAGEIHIRSGVGG